jgi:hypothetical protein
MQQATLKMFLTNEWDRMLDSSNVALFHVVLITVKTATLKEPVGLMFHEVLFWFLLYNDTIKMCLMLLASMYLA